MSNIIWDSMFIQGNIIVFKAIIAIFNLLKTELMGKSNIEEINLIFDENTKYLNDFNYINYYLILKKFEFNFKIIELNRRELEDNITESINQTNRLNLERVKTNKDENKKASFMKNINECFEEWPICIYDNDYKYRIVKYFYFMIYPENIRIIKNYFYAENETESKLLYKINFILAENKIEDLNKQEKDENLISSGNFPNDKIPGESYEDYELGIYKELLIERRVHYCCNRNNNGENVFDILQDLKSEKLSEKLNKNDSLVNISENVVGSENSNNSILNASSDTSKFFLSKILENKIRDMLKLNEGEFLFSNSDPNLILMIKNMRNCKFFFYFYKAKLSFPDEIVKKRTSKIQLQIDYEQQILNKFV